MAQGTLFDNQRKLAAHTATPAGSTVVKVMQGPKLAATVIVPPAPMTAQRRIASLGGHGILAAQDLADLDEGCKRVLAFMRDGEWHAAVDIINASGQREGLRRMRELRRFFVVERRRMASRRDFEYRLVMTNG